MILKTIPHVSLVTPPPPRKENIYLHKGVNTYVNLIFLNLIFSKCAKKIRKTCLHFVIMDGVDGFKYFLSYTPTSLSLNTSFTYISTSPTSHTLIHSFICFLLNTHHTLSFPLDLFSLAVYKQYTKGQPPIKVCL